MNQKIPGPIQNRIMRLIICTIAVIVAGTVWSIASHDKTMGMLSLTLALICFMKIITLYRTSREENYEVHEGIVLSSKALPLRKRQELALQQEDGLSVIILEGRTKFMEGVRYRIYTERQSEVLQDTGLPQTLMPGRALLGFEALE